MRIGAGGRLTSCFWVDWWVLWTLFYVLCLQSWGLPSTATTSVDSAEFPES